MNAENSTRRHLMSIANDHTRLIPIILGLVKVPFDEVASTGDRVFRVIDKHGLGAVDLHVFRRELMKLDREVETETWRRFFALLGTGTDNKVHLLHFQRAIKKHERMLRGVRSRSDVKMGVNLSPPPKGKTDSVWVRGDATLNRLSGTTLFDMSVVDGSSLRHIYQVFCDMDSESNGWITLRGMKQYMHRHAASMVPIATSLFNSADQGRQGVVSFEKLMHTLYPSCMRQEVRKMIAIARQDQHRSHTRIDSATMEDVIEIFKVYDDNGDNTLDLEEFCSAVKSLGWSDSEANEVFHEIDQDHSGLVSLEEFVQWFTSTESTDTLLNSNVKVYKG